MLKLVKNGCLVHFFEKKLKIKKKFEFKKKLNKKKLNLNIS